MTVSLHTNAYVVRNYKGNIVLMAGDEMRAILGRKRKKLYGVFLVVALLTAFVVIAQMEDSTDILPAKSKSGPAVEVIFPITMLMLVVYVAARDDEGPKL